MMRILKQAVICLTVGLCASVQAAVGEAVSLCNVGRGTYGPSTFASASETYSFCLPADGTLSAEDWVRVDSIALGMNSSQDAAKTPRYLKVNGVLSAVVNGTGNQVTNVKFGNNALKQTYAFARLLVRPGETYALEFCSDAAGTPMGEMRWYLVHSETDAPVAQSATSPGWRITQEVLGRVVDNETVVFDNELPGAADIARFTDENWAGTVWIRNYRPSAYWPIPFDYGRAGSVVRFSNTLGYFQNGAYAYAIDLVDEGEEPALTVNAGGSTSTTVLRLAGTGTLKNTYSHRHLFQIDTETYGFTGSLDVGGKRFEIGTGTAAAQNQIVVDAGRTATVGAGATWTATAGVVVDGRVTVEGSVAGVITGTGTIAYPSLAAADANRTSFQAEAWRGTVEIAPIVTTGASAVQVDLAAYGQANSTLVLKGLAGSAGRYLPGNTHIREVVRIDGTVELNNGGWTANYYFDGGVTGSGDLRLLNWRGNDGFDKGYHIARLFAYTGMLTATRATTIDVLDLAAEPETGTRLVKLAQGSSETLRVTKLTINGADAPATACAEVRADGIYYVNRGDLTTEETTTVRNRQAIRYLSIGANGVETFAGAGGVLVDEFAVKAGGRLVFDPIKTPVKLSAAPTFEPGAKLALAAAYAGTTLGKLTLLTWTGAPVEIPEGLFDADTVAGPVALTCEAAPAAGDTQLVLRVGDYETAAKTIRIMPLGDSITDGTSKNAAYEGNPNYRVPLMQKLAARGYRPVTSGLRECAFDNRYATDAAGVVAAEAYRWHSGVSGARVRTSYRENRGVNGGWREAIETTLDAAGDVDVITFKIGTNDAGDDQALVFAAWKDVMWRILNARPNVKIVVASILNMNGNDVWESGYNARIRAQVELDPSAEGAFPAGRVFFVDLHEACPRATDGIGNFTDAYHPNWIGHDRTSDAWVGGVERAIAAMSFPTADDTFAKNVQTGAENNVPAAYRAGYVKLAAKALPKTSAGAAMQNVAPVYDSVTAGAADLKLKRIAYYLELKNRKTGHVRYVWTSLDAFGAARTLSGMGLPTDYAKWGEVTNLRVCSNDTGVHTTAPDAEGVRGRLQFTYGGVEKGGSEAGAPTQLAKWDWNDAIKGTEESPVGGYGAMQVYRVFDPVATDGNGAETLFAFNRWSSGAGEPTEVGIGNFAMHGAYAGGDTANGSINYMFTSGYATVDASAYAVANLEIWGQPEAERSVTAGGAPLEVAAESAEKAVEGVSIVVSDAAAAAAGQADVLRLVATRKAGTADRWLVAADIDAAKIVAPGDTLSAFAREGLAAVAGAESEVAVALPAESVTPGLYYSLLSSADLGFGADRVESGRVLACPGRPVTLAVPHRDGPSAFFKLRVGVTAE